MTSVMQGKALDNAQNGEQLHDTHEQGCEEGLYGLCLYTVSTAA